MVRSFAATLAEPAGRDAGVLRRRRADGARSHAPHRPRPGARATARCGGQSLPHAAGTRPVAAGDHDRLASRFGAGGRQLRWCRRRRGRHGDAGALAAGRVPAAAGHHRDVRARRGAVVVSRALYRQPRSVRTARGRGAGQLPAARYRPHAGPAHGRRGLRAGPHPRRRAAALGGAHPLFLRAPYRAGAGAGPEGRSGRHRHRHPGQSALSPLSCEGTLRPCRRRTARVAAGCGAGGGRVRASAGSPVDRARERPARISSARWDVSIPTPKSTP